MSRSAMIRRRVSAFAAPALLLVAVGFVKAEDRHKVATQKNVYTQLVRSTAWIITPVATGSGILLDRQQRLVATNFHVVADADEVKIVFPTRQGGNIVAERKYYAENLDRLAIKGTVVSRDVRRDLALVKLERIPDDVVAIKLADEAALPGQMVHSIGNPGASEALWNYSSGSVRQVYETRMRLDKYFVIEARIVETQAPLNGGDSGGPVVNDDGELVGVVSGVRRDASLMSFCIDASELRGLLRGEVKAIDRRIRKSLDESKLPFAITRLGDFRLKYTMEDKSEEVVIIESQTEPLGKSRIREIYAVAKELDKPLTADEAARLLLDTHDRIVGAWELRRENGKDYLVFCTRVPADFDAASLTLVAREAAIHTHDVRKQLTAHVPAQVAAADGN